MRFGGEPLAGAHGDMARQIHGIIKNSKDFDHLALASAVHNEMPAAATCTCDVERPKIGQDFFASCAAPHVGASF